LLYHKLQLRFRSCDIYYIFAVSLTDAIRISGMSKCRLSRSFSPTRVSHR